jgi:CheY-specific phosphatase CheX
MDTSLKEALRNFCVYQLGCEPKLDKRYKPKFGIKTAYIDIDADIGKFRVCIIADKLFAQSMAKVYFEEDESDDEILEDIMLECANFIIGNAKVIAGENGLNFNISTPVIEKDIDLKTYEIITTAVCNDSKLLICFKELN